MLLLGLDIGTTSCKVGLIGRDGTLHRLVRRPTVTRYTAEGLPFYDPEALWEGVVVAMREVCTGVEGEIAALGIASMAEAGLLIERRTGAPHSHIIPWFDTRSMPQAERIAREANPEERFRRTGLYVSFKHGLSKLLWLREQGEGIPDGTTWLSVADYIAYRLTGRMATEYTLAARTFAFDVEHARWDEEWIRYWGFQPSLFPEALPSGQLVGVVHTEAGASLPVGAPVVIAGHDHLCAALAVGAIRPGLVFDSMGTAETLIGSIDGWEVVREQGLAAGLTFGRHVVPERYYWLGGLPASGGSVEWLRSLLGDDSLSYDTLLALLDEAGDAPGEILYFPYLSGSGAPCPDSTARAAFVGLAAGHGRAALLKAVLEGTAYEMEAIRRRAQEVTGVAIERITAAGGGTRNRRWLQIKADVCGCPIEVDAAPEATVLGAALVAGIGCGLYRSVEEALAATRTPPADTIHPDQARHTAYRRLYEQGYAPLQQPLRAYYSRDVSAQETEAQ